MLDIQPLSVCNLDEVVDLYYRMLIESREYENKEKDIKILDREIRNILQYRFDFENTLFFVGYLRNKAVGFIDSTRLIVENRRDEWYIKTVYLKPDFREINNYRQLVYKVEKEAKLLNVTAFFSNESIEDSELNAIWEELGYTLADNRRTKKL